MEHLKNIAAGFLATTGIFGIALIIVAAEPYSFVVLAIPLLWVFGAHIRSDD